MLTNQFLLGSLIITVCVIFHVLSLLVLSKILKKAGSYLKHLDFLKNMIILIFSVLFVIAVHMVEIIIWAFTYLHINEFDNLSQSIYFSTVTSTTLGYGDIVLSNKAQLLSGFEAIGGLILFGVSTAYFIKLIAIFFNTSNASEA